MVGSPDRSASLGLMPWWAERPVSDDHDLDTSPGTAFDWKPVLALSCEGGHRVATGSVGGTCSRRGQLPVRFRGGSMRPTTLRKRGAGSQASRLGQVVHRLSEEPSTRLGG